MTTTLYVPGDRPDRFDKALASGADEIIIDLEDAVPEAAKSEARGHAATWLAANPEAPAWVRVNNRTDLLDTDIEMAGALAHLGIVMPKADVASCRDVEVPVLALIESARGVLEVAAVAALPLVKRLAIGEADLAADLGIEPSSDDRELWPFRAQLVVASAAQGLAPPTGPVFTDLEDDVGLQASSETLRRQGFGGRSAIHPAQVPAIRDVFAPSADDVARAQAVIHAYEAAGADSGGVAVVDGEFVDAAVVRRARTVIARATT